MPHKNWGGPRPELHRVNNNKITIKEAAIHYGIAISRLRSRIKYGKTLQEAVDIGPEIQKHKAIDKGGGNAAWAELGV